MRYAVRQLVANPWFAIVVDTAIFSLIDHVMLRFLPVRNPEELLVICRMVSYPRYEDFTVFSSLFDVHLITHIWM